MIGLNKTDHYELWELYRIGNESPIQFNKIGKWSLSRRLEMTPTHKWHRRGNLKLHHFNFTALPETPFMISIKENPFTGIYETVGAFSDLIDLYARTLNFTFTLKPPPDNAWGGKQPDGSWNGMMKLVKEQKVDIATTSLFQTDEREEDASFGLPLKFSYCSLFIKNPAGVYNYTAYLEPVTYLAWGFILLFLLIVPLFIFMIAYGAEEKISLPWAFENVYVTLIMMGATFNPERISTKIIFGWYVESW